MEIQKITSGTTIQYRVQIDKPGFPALYAIFNTQQKARKWYAEQIALIDSGDFGIIETTEHSVAELFDRYIK